MSDRTDDIFLWETHCGAFLHTIWGTIYNMSHEAQYERIVKTLFFLVFVTNKALHCNGLMNVSDMQRISLLMKRIQCRGKYEICKNYTNLWDLCWFRLSKWLSCVCWHSVCSTINYIGTQKRMREWGFEVMHGRAVNTFGAPHHLDSKQSKDQSIWLRLLTPEFEEISSKLFAKSLSTQRFSIFLGVIGQRPRGRRTDGSHRSTLENIWGASFMSFAECCPDERNRILVSPLHRQTSLAPTLRMI